MDEGKNTLFRKTSLDKISTPEKIDEYIKVANPGMWIIMLAIISLLLGICVWGVFGRIEIMTINTEGTYEMIKEAPKNFIMNESSND